MLRPIWQQQLGTVIALAYLIGALWWTLPAGVPFKNEMMQAYAPAFRALSLFQDWSMFAPNPRRDDIYTSSRIYYASGQVRSINLTNMAEMTYGERYRKERWRKFLNDYVRTESHSFLQEPFARWLMRLAESESGEPVTKIELYRHWQPTKAVGQVAPVSWQQQMFYEILQHRG